MKTSVSRDLTTQLRRCEKLGASGTTEPTSNARCNHSLGLSVVLCVCTYMATSEEHRGSQRRGACGKADYVARGAEVIRTSA